MAHVDFLLLLCLFGLTTQLTECFELNNDGYTEELIRSVLHRRIDDVPKLHAVHIETFSKHRSRRSTEPDFGFVRFEIDGKKYNLKLVWRRRPVFTLTAPVWTITSVPGQDQNYTYKVVDQKDTLFDGVFVEDDENMAMLITYFDEGLREFLYDGIFGLGTETHVIRSVPEKWRPTYKLSKNTILAGERYNKHIVYKAKEQIKNCKSHTALTQDIDAMNELTISYPDLYVKILPVIDYELFKFHGENIQETLKYVTTFWNAVDMRFNRINSFKIEIIVTGVVIATDERALNFIDLSRENVNSTKLNARVLLEEARLFFYENFIKDTNYTNYDAIFVMTALNTKPTAGMSYIGRICNRLYSTAFIQDDAGFLGLHSAVHELGHLLNFFHDGSDRAKNCEPFNDSNISTVMAPFITASKAFVWSRCSLKSLEEFMKTKASKCLREKYRIK